MGNLEDDNVILGSDVALARALITQKEKLKKRGKRKKERIK